ncbi:unnamed protein product [Somion occarium]|uniref:Peptidase M20 dimerisation domain-containing protein n=1 Tax=Somion occarium TaxID=3059160 RepID=A0ABP1E5W8_9APHY
MTSKVGYNIDLEKRLQGSVPKKGHTQAHPTLLSSTSSSDDPRDVLQGEDRAWFSHWKPFLAGLLLSLVVVQQFPRSEQPVICSPNASSVCPAASPIAPSVHADLLKQLEISYATEGFKINSFALLGGAVKIPTEMFDDMKVPGQDPRWDVFNQLHGYIDSHFIQVYRELRKTTINTYGLVYHWQGSNPDLKPLLLTAHQDVVPVEPLTVDTWLYPPFSGTWDGKWIWGRGSCDDKPGLIGSLTAIEKLLEKGFKPQRTIVLAFGIDEERGGIVGGTGIRDYLLSAYGPNAFALLIDEGGTLEAHSDGVIATPAVAEKGHFDLRMSISTPGGHSSVPPEHTSIGILAALIAELEANPFTPHLYRNEPYFTALQCQALVDPEMDDELRDLIGKARYSDKALADLEERLFRNPLSRALAGTTQATDIVHGGVKTNALPENAFAIVNHRIAGHSSVSTVKTHIAAVLLPIVKKFNLSLDAFGESLNGELSQKTSGHLKLSDAWGTALEPAPVTPWLKNPAYDLLAGTILNVVKTSARWNNPDIPVIVAPGTMTGNTGEFAYTAQCKCGRQYSFSDTRYYWNLTQNIFRYGHVSRFDKYNGAHTVNEAILADAFIDLIRFFTIVILNADESKIL